jgi:hypothetical protein
MNHLHRSITVALGISLIAFSAAVADPNARIGMQTGDPYEEPSVILVQPGTGYQLHGAPGDHDIYFYDQDSYLVGKSYACGFEIGVVPPDARWGVIVMWDTTGAAGGVVGAAVEECQESLLPVDPGSSMWIYVDGLSL